MKGWLKAHVIASNKPVHSIVDRLKANLGGMQKGRRRDTLHASDLTKQFFCPRQEALLDIAGVAHGKDEFISTAMAATYSMGHATADTLIHQWAGTFAVGNWYCRRCGDFRTMCKRPTGGVCSASNGKPCLWQYREVVVESPVHGFSGAVDVFFDVGTPALMVTELKTMNPDEFEKIVAPLPEHRIRTNLYLRLWAESDSPYKNMVNLHEGRVLYVSRAHGKKNEDHEGEILPFKEYEVTRNDQDLLPILKKADQLKVFRETGAMPSGICATALDKAAKACSTCISCFAGQYPAQQEPL